jgi:hypothetical protein
LYPANNIRKEETNNSYREIDQIGKNQKQERNQRRINQRWNILNKIIANHLARHNPRIHQASLTILQVAQDSVQIQHAKKRKQRKWRSTPIIKVKKGKNQRVIKNQKGPKNIEDDLPWTIDLCIFDKFILSANLTKSFGLDITIF